MWSKYWMNVTKYRLYLSAPNCEHSTGLGASLHCSQWQEAPALAFRIVPSWCDLLNRMCSWCHLPQPVTVFLHPPHTWLLETLIPLPPWSELRPEDRVAGLSTQIPAWGAAGSQAGVTEPLPCILHGAPSAHLPLWPRSWWAPEPLTPWHLL